MKKIKIARIVLMGLLTAALVCGSIGCKAPTEKGYFASDWTVIPANTNPNLRYFGYFHSDGFNNSPPYYEDIAALNNANVLMINSAFETARGIEALEQTRKLGMQAFYTIHTLFTNQQTGRPGSAVLRPDWLAAWRTIKKNLDPFISDGTLLGFYFDEPYWNGIKEEDFLLVSRTLRKEAPSVKLMACLTAMEIGISSWGNLPEISTTYYRHCTDLMYDSYVDWSDEQRRTFTEKLKAKAVDGQYLWACPKGFVDSYEEEGDTQMISHIKGCYTEAVQDERFAGIVSFSFAGGIDGGDWGYGLHSFFDDDPDNDYYNEPLKRLYIDIGRAVTGRTETAEGAPVIEAASVTAVAELGSIPVPAASVNDDKDEGLRALPAVRDPAGKAVPVNGGAFQASYGGRYRVSFVATDSDHNTTKKTVSVWVRGEGEISAFEDELYLTDVSADEGGAWTVSIDRERAYAGSRASLKVQTSGAGRLYFTMRGQKTFDLSSKSEISIWVYNPTGADIETVALFAHGADEGEGVSVSEPLKAKKWTEMKLTRSQISSAAPGLDLAAVYVGLEATGADVPALFWIDDATIR